jgi:hypothetical protein
MPMTIPCENKEDIKSLHTKVDNLANSFNNFQLKTSVAVAVLQTEVKKESKKAGGVQGGFWGALVVVVVSIVEYFAK